MSEKGTGRPKATAILAGCASLVTIFTWIGITPAAVGQSVYDALCIAWPFLVAGLAFLAGWNLKKIWVSRELDKRAARIAKLEKSATDAAGRIAELENQARDRDSALESATRKNGAIERELDDLRKTAHRIIAEKDKALHRMVEAEAEREELKARLAEYEDIEAREAERRRRHLDGIAAEIKDLHANVKLVILALYDEGPIRDLHFHDFGGARGDSARQRHIHVEARDARGAGRAPGGAGARAREDRGRSQAPSAAGAGRLAGDGGGAKGVRRLRSEPTGYVNGRRSGERSHKAGKEMR